MEESQPAPALDPDEWAGAPLRSTLKLLAVPGVILALVTVFGVSLPVWLLYGVGAVFGLVLLGRVSKDPEPLLAIAIFYLPMSKLIVIGVAPGVNGTNVLLVLLVFACFRHAPEGADARDDGSDAPQTTPSVRAPAAGLVRAYGVWTMLSVVTAMVVVGFDFVRDRGEEVKQWLDQFIIFFTFSRLIRDGKMARRVTVYMMLAAAVVLVLGLQEWFEKRDASSMEKARLLGPQLQPNDFGAYLAYGTAPYIALLLNNIRRPRILALTVPFLIGASRVLIATFSRGSYLAVALAGVVAGYVRGRMFLIGTAVAGLLLVIAVPQIVPESLQARMGQTFNEPGASSGTEKLDSSAQTRITLWDAAWKITKRSPVFGYGFRTFPKFKDEFTEVAVPESDNHNMYLYLSSQMGIPATVLFVLILWRMASLGIQVYRRSDQNFTRVVGMGAAALAAAAFLVNMFGSRMVDICVSVNFWVTLAVVSRIWMDVEARRAAEGSG